MSLVPKIAIRSPTLDSGASNSTGTVGKQSARSDRAGIRKPGAIGLNENTGSSSQVWHQNEHTNTGTGKTVSETINTNLTHHDFQISNVNHIESLFIFTTEIESPSRGRNAGHRSQCVDLENLHVCDHEGGTRESAYNQEHLLRAGHHIVRSLAEFGPLSQNQIFGISTIEWNTSPWMRTTLLHDRAIKLSNAKVHVYSDSLLCLWKIHECPYSIRHWTDKIWMVHGFPGLSRIEWNWRRAGHDREEYFPRTHNTGTAPWDSKEDGRKQNQTWGTRRSNHLHVDVQWHRLDDSRKLQKVCFEFYRSFKACAHRFPKGHGSFLGPGTVEQWYGTHTYRPVARWNQSAEMIKVNLGESRHSEFRASSALDRRFLTVTCRLQSCHFAQPFPSTSSVCTERFRGVERLTFGMSTLWILVDYDETACDQRSTTWKPEVTTRDSERFQT